jgi:uncharacterized protein (DUF697 family)
MATAATAEEVIEETPATEILSPAERTTQAGKTVRNYTLASVAVGLVPMPLVDIAALTAVQLKMLHGLAKLYDDVSFTKELARSTLGSLLSSAIPVYYAQPVALSLAKFIPVAGHALGMASLPVLGGAATYAVGKVFIQHFESGGTFLTFDPEKVRDYFMEQLAEGKKVAAEGTKAEG